MIRVPYERLLAEFTRVLLEVGFEEERARACARIFADASRDGVHSHGLNRFPLFVSSIEDGFVRVDAQPVLLHSAGSLERWDGCLGPGNLNAWFAMSRAIELSKEAGIGCVALQNTNHWMRGGTYGWQAAEAGVIGICWSNTRPNLPPWGAVDPRLGNNPLVIGVPRDDAHVVLDMAITQFSYGQLERHRLAGEPLPVVGGYDTAGELTRDPEEIERSQRPLPVGFWKGSGLSLALDLVVSMLSGGKAVHEITPEESGLSQLFIAIDPAGTGGREGVAEEIISFVNAAAPVQPEGRVFYPGERSLLNRRESNEKGVLVVPEIWERVQELYA